MNRRKGLTRLAFFIIFLIPVLWYIFLQLFGDNRFSLEVQQTVADSCQSVSGVTVLYRFGDIKESEKHYFSRVSFHTQSQEVPFIQDTINFFQCIQNDQDLVLVNEEGIWGSYEMSREGVDLLLPELDILLLQKSYGKGVGR